jgi:glycogen debranching enzyme
MPIKDIENLRQLQSDYGVLDQRFEFVYSNEDGQLNRYPVKVAGEELFVDYAVDGTSIDCWDELSLDPIFVLMCRPSPFDDEEGLCRSLKQLGSEARFLEYLTKVGQDIPFGISASTGA